MEAEGQADIREALRKADHGVGDADGGNEQVVFGEVEEAFVAQDFQTLEKIVFVMKRLAHAHDDDVAQCPALFAQKPFGEQNLIEHFGGGEVANQTEFAGGAEGAAGGAADLRGDAEAGASGGDAQDDGFDAMIILGRQNQFRGPVHL